MFSSLGFLFPSLLILVPLVGAALFYVYLRRGQGRRLKVSSLLLLKSFEASSIARKKFFPPPRFFLELLILILLIAGASGLFLKEDSNRVALLIDNSFGMSAMEVSTRGGIFGEGRSLLELAREQAVEVSRRHSSGQQIDLYVTSPELRMINSAPLSLGGLESNLNQVLISYAADNLQNAIDELGSNSNYEKILVFTDNVLQIASTSMQDDDRIMLTTVGQPGVQNIAISEFTFQSDPLSDDRGVLRVVASSYTTENARVTVELRGVEFVDNTFTFHSLEKRDIELGANSQEILDIEIRDKKFELYHANLTVNNHTLDAIPDDNSAWLSTRAGGQSLTLVGPLSPEVLKLNDLQEINLSYMTPAEYRSAVSSGQLPETQGYIFHRFSPAELPKKNSILIAPQPPHTFLASSVASNRSEITQWREAHPVNSYLNFSLLTLRNHFSLQTPFWAEEIISSTSGSAAFAGESSGYRVLATGFDIFPFEGKASPVLSIFTLNSIRWILDQSLSFGSVSTYGRLFTEPGSEVFYTGADGLTVKAGSAENERAYLELPGLYAYRDPQGASSFTAVNFFNEQESNTLVQRQVLASVGERAGTASDSRFPITNLLIFLALLLIVLDMLIATRFFNLFSRGRFTPLLQKRSRA